MIHIDEEDFYVHFDHVVHFNPTPTYQDAVVQCHECGEGHRCTYCGTIVYDAGSNVPACGTVLCTDCMSNYVSTLFEYPPRTEAVPCPCNCGSTLPWSLVARSVPDDIMTRLVRLYAPPPLPPPIVSPPSLKSMARRKFEEASNLCAPCCSAVFANFDNCFSVKCFACQHYFCAWCLEYTSVCSDECHAHVRICGENPHQGAVYGDMQYWLDVHRDHKRQRFLKAAYMDTVDEIMYLYQDLR